MKPSALSTFVPVKTEILKLTQALLSVKKMPYDISKVRIVWRSEVVCALAAAISICLKRPVSPYCTRWHTIIQNALSTVDEVHLPFTFFVCFVNRCIMHVVGAPTVERLNRSENLL